MKQYSRTWFKIFTAVLIVVAVVGTNSKAQAKYEDILQAFRYYINVSPKISVPTVVEVPMDGYSFSPAIFAVYNVGTGEIEPYYLHDERKEIEKTIEISGNSKGNKNNLTDGNDQTYLEFPLTNTIDTVQLEYDFVSPITSSSLYFYLPPNVAKPETVAISAMGPYGNSVAPDESSPKLENVVLAPTRVTSATSILFPQTIASVWKITFTYSQPLRIAEMNFEGHSYNGNVSVRFLAQPGQTYRIYSGVDRYVEASSSKESGDLASSAGVLKIEGSEQKDNDLFVPSDMDKDGIIDANDNCPSISNTDQKDSDNNSQGDACEDYDRDSVMNAFDNCPDAPNFRQEDTDADGKGDVCDDKDNRLTENMPWLPWAGIGLAIIVVLGLFVSVLKHGKKDMGGNMSQDL